MWQRLAIYWFPDGELGALGAQWLGWDARAGRAVADACVDAPKARRYGLHATLVAPFHLVEGGTFEAVRDAARDCADNCAPVDLGHLRVAPMGWMIAMRPALPAGIAEVAGRFLRALDAHRAGLDAADRDRRGRNLSPRQKDYLARWGYAYVLDEFRPHLTLSGGQRDDDLTARASAHFAPALADPYRMTHVSLAGEDGEGRFHRILDLPLGGAG